MLVQKVTISKTTKILLAVLGGIVILGGGYFLIGRIMSKSKTSSTSGVTAVKTTQSAVPSIESDLFNNPSFYTTSKQPYAGFTNQHEAIALSDTKPLPVENCKVINPARGRSLVVSWQLPKYINFNRVRIYRSEQTKVLGQEVVTLDVKPESSLLPMSYRDTDLTDGIIYYYHIVTVNKDDQSSDVLEEPAGKPTDIFPPDAPTEIQVNVVSALAVEISWVNPTDQDFALIHIYRSSQRGELGSIIYYEGTGTTKEDDPTRQVFIDKTIKANIPYYYTVTSLDHNGNESSTDVLAVPVHVFDYNPFAPLSF
jgi:hypothetical protein